MLAQLEAMLIDEEVVLCSADIMRLHIVCLVGQVGLLSSWYVVYKIIDEKWLFALIVR